MKIFERIKYCLWQIILEIALSITTAFPCQATVATDIPEPPKYSYIVDLADILDTSAEIEINSAIATLQQHKYKNIYLITVPSIEQTSTPKKFKVVPVTPPSRKFLESILLNWNQKQIERGNSILFLVSVADRSIEIRSSFNLVNYIRDCHIQGIIDKIIVPEFKRNNFEQGILLGIDALIIKIDNPYFSSLPQPKHSTRESQKKARCWQRLKNRSWRSIFDDDCSAEVSYYGGSGRW